MTSAIAAVYTCTACKERFATRDLMKAHCTSEFHAFNLSRKTEGMTPVDRHTYESLASKVESAEEKMKYRCTICKKTYGSVQTLSAHLRSRTHQENKALVKSEPDNHLAARCKFCDETTHAAETCPNYECNRCHEKGHFPKNCPTRLQKKKDAEAATEAKKAKKAKKTATAAASPAENSLERTETPSQSTATASTSASSSVSGSAPAPTPTATKTSPKSNKTTDDVAIDEDEEEEEDAESEDDGDVNGKGSEEEKTDRFSKLKHLERRCLFCPRKFGRKSENLRHMFEAHSFRLPLWEWVSDETGLLTYLHYKLHARICLWCNERSKHFPSLKALRLHMADKGHNQIDWDHDADEYAEYYDIPESTAWMPRANDAGEAILPDGRRILSRAAEAPVNRNSGAGALIDLSAKRNHPFQFKRAIQLQLPLAEIRRLNLKPAAIRQLIMERRDAIRKRNRYDIQMQRGQNRPMFHGFFI